MESMENLRREIRESVEELFEQAKLREKSIFIMGCSTSEVVGDRIGKGSVPEIGKALVDEVKQACDKEGVYLAVQCCEHLNRALVVERECMDKYNLEQVTVIPAIHAGGSAATAAMALFDDPVVVERIQGHAAIDIGDTLIGMHLRPVAVPVRLKRKQIGEAHLTAARVRPKLIGGERAQYK